MTKSLSKLLTKGGKGPDWQTGVLVGHNSGYKAAIEDVLPTLEKWRKEADLTAKQDRSLNQLLEQYRQAVGISMSAIHEDAQEDEAKTMHPV